MIILSSQDAYRAKEELYISVRNAEDRVVEDALLKQLPYTPESYSHHNEWMIRAKSYERFSAYLTKHYQKAGLDILDVGCGNGWMSNRLFSMGHNITATDLNLRELEQAEKVFGTHEKLQWVYCDILKDNIINAPFDIIVFAASCQYFPDISALTEKMKPLLKKNGAIHLLDSFFYTEKNICVAQTRTQQYYSGMNYPEMSNYYFHHLSAHLKKTGYKKLYPGLLSPAKNPEWWILNK